MASIKDLETKILFTVVREAAMACSIKSSVKEIELKCNRVGKTQIHKIF